MPRRAPDFVWTLKHNIQNFGPNRLGIATGRDE